MSKKKLAVIIVGCVVVAIVVAVIATHSPGLPSRGPGYLAACGSYMLTEASTTSTPLFSVSDIGVVCIDLKNDGTFRLRFTDEGIAYAGEWTLNGNTVELQTDLWGSPIVWTGTVSGNTISLGDGSVWSK